MPDEEEYDDDDDAFLEKMFGDITPQGPHLPPPEDLKDRLLKLVMQDVERWVERNKLQRAWLDDIYERLKAREQQSEARPKEESPKPPPP